MDKKIINSVNKQVYQKYPEIQGVQPSIRNQGKSGSPSQKYTLTYKKSITLTQGTKLPVVVRVVCTADGKILKISSSR